jgi:hypothetical protein
MNKIEVGQVYKWQWGDGNIIGRILSISNNGFVKYKILHTTGVYNNTYDYNIGTVKHKNITERNYKVLKLLKSYDTPLYKVLNNNKDIK